MSIGLCCGLFLVITPYIRMLDSDWLIAVIFFLQIQALHCEFSELLLHVGVFALDLTIFFMVFAKSYLPILPYTETLVTKFVKRYQLCILCNNRICRFYPSPGL